MAYWLLVPVAYQILILIAIIVFLRKRDPVNHDFPDLSILKPTAPGDTPRAEAIESHLTQNYPGQVELIWNHEEGVSTPNRKVGKLMQLSSLASHSVWIVNDADIVVPPDYLKRVIPLLNQPGVGMVTCLYRAKGDSVASNFEALGVATDFMPSVLVARFVGVREFGLGATLAFRQTDLEKIGGFAAIADYIADDYQLAKKITELGQRAEVSTAVVETTLHGNWISVWKHQQRWAKTIRCSRTASYFGLPITHAGFWALVSLDPVMGGFLIGLRILTAWMGGVAVLKSQVARRWFWLAPVWDIFAFAVWLTAWFRNTVEWGGRKFRLDAEGRILP